MTIDPYWKRIAGVHAQTDGTIGAVWLAWDTDIDLVHVYDACLFKREVLAVVIEGMNARGRWIPIAWPKSMKEISDKMLERGCNMTHEPVATSQEMAEAISLEVWERMRSHRMKVDKRLGEWLEEFKTFQRQGQKLPVETHPLMAATRYAVDLMRDYARRQQPKQRGKPTNYPEVSII